MASAIENYALLGDCETAALVGRDGSIDWLCWPRFDSAACFAALVGSSDNGRWLLDAAEPDAHLARRYRDETLILETTIEGAGGTAIIVDFMPPRRRTSSLVRHEDGQVHADAAKEEGLEPEPEVSPLA